MDIKKYFTGSEKKCDLGEISNDETDLKKQRNNNLLWLLEILVSKMNEIYMNTNTLKENQIKGEDQITDLAKIVIFFEKNFTNMKQI